MHTQIELNSNWKLYNFKFFFFIYLYIPIESIPIDNNKLKIIINNFVNELCCSLYIVKGLK